jgi:hypothetical protein
MDAHGGLEYNRVVSKYIHALEKEVPIGNAREILAALVKVMRIVSPEETEEFNLKVIPSHLQELYTIARVAKDNYVAAMLAFIADENGDGGPIRQVPGQPNTIRSR